MRGTTLISVTGVLAATVVARAEIDLVLVADAPTVAVGETVIVELYAVSDDGETNQLFSAAQSVFTWDPAVFELVSTSSDGAVASVFNGLPLSGDFDLNEADPPQDGDGFHLLLAPLGTRATATPAGALLHRFEFVAVAPGGPSAIDLAPSGGSGAITRVIDGTVPGLDVTGALIGALVEVTAGSCRADIDDDGSVGFSDLVILLSAWGPCPGCPADLDADDVVGFSDLVTVLSAWGAC